MDLDFSDEQRQVRDAARRFLLRECPPELVRKMREDGASFPDNLWQRMASLGWLGLPFLEHYGGSESEWVTLAVIMEELGRISDPTPFVDCILDCGWRIQELASEEQKERWLPLIVQGKLKLSFADQEDGISWSDGKRRTTLTKSTDAIILEGQKCFVENADNSEFLLVTATAREFGGTCLAMVSPRAAGVNVVKLRSLAHPNLYRIDFCKVSISQDQVIGWDTDIANVLSSAITRTTAFQSIAAVGGARRILEMTVDYAKERRQFGKAIGSFQAVQHMLANVWSEIETAELAAYEALTFLELGLPAADKVAVAKCASNETFVRTCFTAHQIFGGMGFMWETDLHLWTRKAKEIELAGGGLHRYRMELAEFL